MKKNRTPKYVLSSAALMAFIVAGCANTEETASSSKEVSSSEISETIAPSYQTGDVVLLNGFETMEDMYSMKQTNLGYDSVGKMSITSDKKKEGASSLFYDYKKGGNPQLLQRVDHSHAPTLDWGVISNISVWIFNTKSQDVKANLKVISNGNLALLTSESQSMKTNEWSQLSFNVDSVTRFKNKDSIVGVTLELETDGQEGAFYIDQLEVTIGESITDQDIANPVIEKIAALPNASEITDEKEFIKVLTVKGVYDALTDSQKALVNNVSKLNECIAKTEGYGLLFNAGTDLFTMITSSGSGYNWSGALLNEDDSDFGSRIHLNVSSVGTGNIMELRYGALENAADYNQVIVYIYNPIAEDRTLISATGQGWSGISTYYSLKAQSWNRVCIPMSKINANGGYFLVQQPLSNGWLFSGFLGVTNQKCAEEIIAMIDALPNGSESLTDEDKAAISSAKEAYDALSEEAQKLVTNKEKLQGLVASAIYGELVKPVIALIESLPEATAVNEYSQINAIEKTKEAFDELPDEAKAIVTNASKLESCLAKAAEISKSILAVKSMLSTLGDDLDSQEKIFRFLSTKEIYEALSTSEKEKLTSEEKARYDTFASLTSGYKNLYGAMDNTLLTDPAPGDYTNVSVTRNTINDEFGNVFALKVKTPHSSGASSFKPFGSLNTNGIKAVRFAIYNPTNAWQNMLACYRSDWGNVVTKQIPGEYQVEQGAASSAWSIIEIPVEKFYDQDDVFFVLNGAGPNFDGDESHPVTKGTWLISGFYGVTEDAYFAEKAADTIDLIDKLPDADSITDLSSESQVKEAKSSYDALSEDAKARVTNVQKLEACLAKIEAIIGDLSGKIDAKINALPAPEDLTKENFGTYRDAILEAKNEYTMARQSVKDAVTKSEKLQQLVAKLKEFNPLLAIDLINALPEAEQIASEGDMVQIISVKNFFDTLSSNEQAEVANASKLSACVEKCSKAKSLVSPLAGASGIASGRDTGNPGKTGTMFDSTYGSVFTVNPTNAGTGDFHFNKVDVASCNSLAFKVFNPLEGDTSLVLYDGSWGNQKVYELKAKSWNTIVLDTATYGSNFFFIINSTSAKDGTWLITNLIGLSESALPQEVVLLKGGTEGALKGGANTGSSETIVSATDPEKGTVWAITAKTPNSAGGDFYPMGLNCTGFETISFFVYNPLDKNVNLIHYTNDWGNFGVAANLASKAWTEVTLDVATFGKGFFLVVDAHESFAEGTWLVSSIIGHRAANA